MAGFEPIYSGVRGDHTANCATTTAQANPPCLQLFSTSNFLRQARTNFLHQIEVGSTGQRLLTLEDRVTYCRASIFSSFVSLSRARASDTNICNCCRRSICYGYNGKNFFSLLWFLIKACLPTSLFLSFLLDELQAIANLKLHQTF